MGTRPGIRQRRLAALHRIRRKPLLVVDAVTGDIFGGLAAQISGAGTAAPLLGSGSLAREPAIQHSYRFLTRNRGDYGEYSPAWESGAVSAAESPFFRRKVNAVATHYRKMANQFEQALLSVHPPMYRVRANPLDPGAPRKYDGLPPMTILNGMWYD